MQTWAQQFNVYFPLNGKMHKIQTANTSKILTWTSLRYCAFNCYCWNVLLCYSSGSLEITHKFINFRLLFQKSNESHLVWRKESVVSHPQSLITRIPLGVKVQKDTFFCIFYYRNKCIFLITEIINLFDSWRVQCHEYSFCHNVFTIF